MEIPTNEVINKKRIARFHQKITAGLGRADLDTFANMVEQYRTENDVPLEQIAAALAGLAAGESPLLAADDQRPTGLVESGDSREGSRRSSRDRFGDRQRDGRAERRPSERTQSDRMETFRIEVGRAHNVKPTNIVGAIANETGLESRMIGKIEIFDEHSTVDMAAGMPERMFEMLKQVKIGGRRLNISRLADGSCPDDWPVADTAKAPAHETRPQASPAPEPPAPVERPAPAKAKVKLKPKFAATKATLKRSGRKRLQTTR